MHVSTSGLATSRLNETTGEKFEFIEIKEGFQTQTIKKIKIRPYSETLGFYLLMLAGNVFCLPDNTYIVPEKSLNILNTYNIAYDIIDSQYHEGRYLSESI